MRYAYFRIGGIASDLRYVDPAYVLQANELEGQGEPLPDLNTLCDPAVIAAQQAAAASSQQRQATFDGAISADAQLQSFRTMDKAAFDTWWAANITTAAQAIAVLKKLTWLLIRYVLR